MSRFRKRSLMLALMVVLLVGLLASCASGASDADSQDGQSGTKNGSTEEGQGEISGDFEIQYFVGGYGDTWWKETLKEFNEKYPDLNIKESAGSQINEQMRPRWIQGDPPDVIYIDGDGASAPQMVQDQQLMDITEWAETAENVNGELILDQLISPPTLYDGKMYTLPFVFGAWGTWYDQAFFDENDWEVPTDFESFMAVNKEIKESGIYPYIHQGIYPQYIISGLLIPGFVSENDEDVSILEDMNALKEGVFLSEPVQGTLEKLAQMRDEGYVDPGALALNHTESQMQWLQHKAAYIPSGMWLESEMAQDSPEGFEFAFVPSLLQDPGQNYVVNPTTYSIAIAKEAKNPEAAKAFMEFIFTKEAAQNWAETTGALLNYKVDLSTTEASPAVKSVMDFLNSDDIIVADTRSAMNSDVFAEMRDATVALLGDQITPEEWGKRVEEVAARVR